MDLSKSNFNKISIGDFNAKVYVAPSKIISTVPNVDSGNGLFAAEYLSKQIIVAYYSGFIKDIWQTSCQARAQYESEAGKTSETRKWQQAALIE
jgi:hypothetical protein